MAWLTILPGAVDKGSQEGKGMRLSSFAPILGQVETQGAQLLPALTQSLQPFFGGGELAICLPGQRWTE